MSGYLPDGVTQEMIDRATGAYDPCPHPERASWFDEVKGERGCEDCGYRAFWNGHRWVGNDELPEKD